VARGTIYGTVDGLGAICGSHTWFRGPSMATKLAVDGPGGPILGEPSMA